MTIPPEAQPYALPPPRPPAAWRRHAAALTVAQCTRPGARRQYLAARAKAVEEARRRPRYL